MAAEYTLSYTGAEINARLGQVALNTTKIEDLEVDVSSLEKSMNDKANKSEIPNVSDFITTEDAQSYADTAANNAATTLKNELLNGAGAAYDTLKELGDLIDENATALDALEATASGKADAVHSHDDLYYTEAEIDTLLATKQPAGNYLTSYTETDPTVPSWAKASSKPSYSKSEVGLGNVDNVKQYSASNPPPYPVTSVNGQTGAVAINVPTVPSSLKNPYSLTITLGSDSYTYDGSKAVNIAIADGNEVSY